MKPLILEEKHCNVRHHILPSENAVADRLLKRGIELRDAYEELHDKLHAHQSALQIFLGLVLNTAAFWNPEKILESYCAQRSCQRQSADCRKAEELATLLKQRSDLHDTSGFSSAFHYHVCGVIEAASITICSSLMSKKIRCPSWAVRSEILALAKRMPAGVSIRRCKVCGGGYRPINGCRDSGIALITGRLLQGAVRCYRREQLGELQPTAKGLQSYRSDAGLASKLRLDLGPDDLVDDAYMKRLRQRERNGAR
jgi:hypothetical protein